MWSYPSKRSDDEKVHEAPPRHAGNLDNGVPRICEEDGCALTFVRCEEDREHQEPDEECCPSYLWLSQRQYLNGACLVNRLCHNPNNRQGAVALPTGTAAKPPRRSCFCAFADVI